MADATLRIHNKTLILILTTGVLAPTGTALARNFYSTLDRYGPRRSFAEWRRGMERYGHRYGDHGHEGDALRHGLHPRMPGDRRAGGTPRRVFRPGAYGRVDSNYFLYRNRPRQLGWVPGYLHR